MTPTLLGRWQTRLLLLATVGVIISVPFYLITSSLTYFWILGYVAVFGVIWDIVYDYIQKFRWDHDWSGILQLFAGIWEGIFIVILKFIGLPLPELSGLPLGRFVLHYSLVWLAVFITSQSFMRIIFPRWRFRGGQWF